MENSLEGTTGLTGLARHPPPTPNLGPVFEKKG